MMFSKFDAVLLAVAILGISVLALKELLRGMAEARPDIIGGEHQNLGTRRTLASAPMQRLLRDIEEARLGAPHKSQRRRLPQMQKDLEDCLPEEIPKTDLQLEETKLRDAIHEATKGKCGVDCENTILSYLGKGTDNEQEVPGVEEALFTSLTGYKGDTEAAIKQLEKALKADERERYPHQMIPKMPLNYAACEGYYNCVELLVLKGDSDVNGTNYD